MLWSSKFHSESVCSRLILYRYIPNGNSKLGAVTIENAASDQSIFKFKLFVDGVETWSSILLSPPVVAGKARGKDALWG
jgi:alkaline phosphatase D